MKPGNHINIHRGKGKTRNKAAVKENLMNARLDMANCVVRTAAMCQYTSIQQYGGIICMHMTFKKMTMSGIDYGANIYGDAFEVMKDGTVRLHYMGNKKQNKERRYDDVKDPITVKPIYLAARKREKDSFRFLGELRVVSHVELPNGAVVITFEMVNVDRSVFESNPSWFK